MIHKNSFLAFISLFLNAFHMPNESTKGLAEFDAYVDDWIWHMCSNMSQFSLICFYTVFNRSLATIYLNLRKHPCKYFEPTFKLEPSRVQEWTRYHFSWIRMLFYKIFLKILRSMSIIGKVSYLSLCIILIDFIYLVRIISPC